MTQTLESYIQTKANFIADHLVTAFRRLMVVKALQHRFLEKWLAFIQVLLCLPVVMLDFRFHDVMTHL